MRPKKYKVYLKEKEREILEKLTSSGKSSALIIRRANILLSLDEQNGKVKKQEEIAQMYRCNIALIRTVAKKYIECGLESVLKRKKRETPPVPSKITGDIEAKIIQLACSKPPQGRTCWTLRLLEEKVVELNIIKISDSTIGNILKKNAIKTSSEKTMVHTS